MLEQETRLINTSAWEKGDSLRHSCVIFGRAASICTDPDRHERDCKETPPLSERSTVRACRSRNGAAIDLTQAQLGVSLNEQRIGDEGIAEHQLEVPADVDLDVSQRHFDSYVLTRHGAGRRQGLDVGDARIVEQHVRLVLDRHPDAKRRVFRIGALGRAAALVLPEVRAAVDVLWFRQTHRKGLVSQSVGVAVGCLASRHETESADRSVQA